MLRKKLKLDQDESSSSPPTAGNPNVAEIILDAEQKLSELLDALHFETRVAYVYNPLNYAFDLHAKFIRKYCNSQRKLMFLGMNPGPFGMVQTGIPFGEVNIVRSWFEIDGQVNKPSSECSKKKINGLNTQISEVSGKRFWGLFKNICQIPENFFKNCYVHNYCPLAFLTSTGLNVTPNELEKSSAGSIDLEKHCRQHLLDIINILDCEIIVAIGRYAEKCCISTLKSANMKSIRVLYMLHPSPRVPIKKGESWEQKARQFLETNDLLPYFQH